MAQNNYNNSTDTPKARSGAKFHKFENGVAIYAWKYHKTLGLMKLTATPYSKTKRVKSNSGKTWENWYCRITVVSTGAISKLSGLFSVDNRKLYLKSVNQIVNPSANNGGYWGKHISKNYKK